jgi:hypothetical protein
MRRMAFPACAPPAFSNTVARTRGDPADRAAADRLPRRMLARVKVPFRDKIPGSATRGNLAASD